MFIFFKFTFSFFEFREIFGAPPPVEAFKEVTLASSLSWCRNQIVSGGKTFAFFRIDASKVYICYEENNLFRQFFR